MIVVKLMGGLGNQMFQYALGRNLAIKNNTQLKVDLSFLSSRNPSFMHSIRPYDLDCFNLSVDFATPEEVSKFTKAYTGKFYKRIRKIAPFIFKYKYELERKFSFYPEALLFSNNTYLDGYWQSEKYFSAIRTTLLKDFTFKNEASGQNRSLQNRIENVNSVSIHVRRGDYVSNSDVSRFHGICGLDYYREAVSLIHSKQNSIELFIFSDDIAWCKDNLKFGLPLTYIDHNTGKQSYEDLRLILTCKHNIIANSSFSWWGAWLNPNPKKMVIAPARWFADASINTSDLIPEAWQRI